MNNYEEKEKPVREFDGLTPTQKFGNFVKSKRAIFYSNNHSKEYFGVQIFRVFQESVLLTLLSSLDRFTLDYLSWETSNFQENPQHYVIFFVKGNSVRSLEGVCEFNSRSFSERVDTQAFREIDPQSIPGLLVSILGTRDPRDSIKVKRKTGFFRVFQDRASTPRELVSFVYVGKKQDPVTHQTNLARILGALPVYYHLIIKLAPIRTNMLEMSIFLSLMRKKKKHSKFDLASILQNHTIRQKFAPIKLNKKNLGKLIMREQPNKKVRPQLLSSVSYQGSIKLKSGNSKLKSGHNFLGRCQQYGLQIQEIFQTVFLITQIHIIVILVESFNPRKVKLVRKTRDEEIFLLSRDETTREKFKRYISLQGFEKISVGDIEQFHSQVKLNRDDLHLAGNQTQNREVEILENA